MASFSDLQTDNPRTTIFRILVSHPIHVNMNQRCKEQLIMEIRELYSIQCKVWIHLYKNMTAVKSSFYKRQQCISKLVPSRIKQYYQTCNSFSRCKQILMAQRQRPYYPCTLYRLRSGTAKIGRYASVLELRLLELK